MAKHVYCRHRTEIEVPFFDVDAMHIVWHGHYVKYLEVARCAFLTEIGYDYNEMGRQGFSWPVVQLNLKYVKPARFGQKIYVDLALVEIESCLRIDYTISDAQSGAKLTKASTTKWPWRWRAARCSFKRRQAGWQRWPNIKAFRRPDGS